MDTKRWNALLITAFLILISACVSTSPSKSDEVTLELSTPLTAKREIVKDTYFGTTLEDPYRYMEGLEDEYVQSWFKSHENYTRQVLDSIPGRKRLVSRMLDFENRKQEKASQLAISESNRYFYLKQTPEDENKNLFYRDGFYGKEQLLFNINKFSKIGDKQYSISQIYPSHDGAKVAFDIAANGAEVGELIILDVASRERYPEVINRIFFSEVSWLPDNNAFIYLRLQSADMNDPDSLTDSKSYLHKLNSDPDNDVEILSREKYPELGIKPEEFPIIYLDKLNKMLFGKILTVSNNQKVLFAPLSELREEKINWKWLFKDGDQVHKFRVSRGDLYAFTPKGATNFQIKKLSLDKLDILMSEVIVPEDSREVITDFEVTKEGLFLAKSINGVEAKFYFLPNDETIAREVQLPFKAGSLYVSTRGAKFDDIWVTISGWTNDYQRYRYNNETNIFNKETISSSVEYPEFNNLVVEELTVPSHDGVLVPVSLVYNKDLKKNGSNRVVMMGYGAYGYSIDPFFSPKILSFTMEGGVFAIAHVRGGGELGDEWHKAGKKKTKPNTWKDFIATAEYLIKHQYTRPEHLAMFGGSAGGILIGRTMTERPDLFAVAVPVVGDLNSVRAENTPSGPTNIPEFGTVKIEEEFKALLEMDAFHHLVAGTHYPATMVTAGMNDPRVPAWLPGKFAAKLFEVNASDSPVLLRADFESGHGIGNTKSKDIDDMADMFSFILWNTGHKDFIPALK